MSSIVKLLWTEMAIMSRKLHICFFPFMAHGHTIPTVDMAKLFSSRGVKTSIITTPLNAHLLSKAIDTAKSSGLDIGIELIHFPTLQAGLPEQVENIDFFVDQEINEEQIIRFFDATLMLQKPLEKLLERTRPDCLVSDLIFPWTAEVTSKFGIPRLVFNGMSYLALSVSECLATFQPQNHGGSDTDEFIIPALPGEIKLTRQILVESMSESGPLFKLVKDAREAEKKNFGVIVNSFYELEPVYADFYRHSLGKRSWHIGPVSLINRENEEKSMRGKQTTITDYECLDWLNYKQTYSVIYICFGTTTNFNSIQLKQIAMALEASNQNFIWVVRKNSKGKDEEMDDWLPEGFEARMEGKGLIIRGWAPQLLILDHKAVGVFVTHCGWNSILEGVSAGKTMITWPLFNDQFFNEQLVTQVLKIGLSLGIRRSVKIYGEFVGCHIIEKVVRRATMGEEAQEMRIRAERLRELARHTIEPHGSSTSEFNSLIHELATYGLPDKESDNLDIL